MALSQKSLRYTKITKLACLLTLSLNYLSINIGNVSSVLNLVSAEVDEDGDDLSDLEPDPEPQEAVITLNMATFDKFTVDNERFIVEFYAPWCGHCKSLAPEYEKAAQTLLANKRKTKLTKVDATIDQKLAQDHGVQGYPTLYFYEKGKKIEYDGPRDAKGIVEWVEAREKSPLEICTEEEWQEKVKSKVSPFLLLVRSAKGSGKTNAVKKAMRAYITNSFTSIQACMIPVLKEEEKVSAELRLVRTGAYSDDQVLYPGDSVWNVGKITSFLNESMYTGVGKYSSRIYSYIPKTSLNVDFVVFLAAAGDKYIEDDDSKPVITKSDKEEWIETLRKTGEKKEYKNMRFGIWEGLEDVRKDIAGYKGVTEETIVIAIGVQENKKYILKDPTLSSLVPWLNQLSKKELKPDYKTQPVPASDVDPEDGVTVLVGSTFEKIAFDPKKDVFVEFYAPWCGHCKALAPEWSMLAKTVHGSSPEISNNVVIAKMDATENESPIEISGFPKIVLFPAGKNSEKKQKEFKSGDRKLGAFLDFLTENAKHMEGVEVETPESEKIDKSKFNMVERERKRKQNLQNGKEEL